MKLSKKLLAGALAMMLGVSLVAGCGGQKETPKNAPAQGELSGTVTASGSTALLPLLKPAQEEFQNKNPKVTVNIAGGGSFTGQNQVAAGSVTIGNSDVPLQDSLKDKGLVETKLVGIPFVFITNTDVSVDNLTQQQYVDIFTGKVSNWKEVGGKDQKITIIHRAKSSGSRGAIAEIVLKGAAFTDNAVIQDSNGAVRAAIASTPGAIGYVDAAYADQSVKTLAYNGVKFSINDVIDGKYPVYTFGRMFTKGEPTGAVKAFIDYATSPEFQNVYAEKNGFVPVTKMKK
ncbi:MULTISPECIES: phosphate ABC transporter substrate-binding protein [Sporomusa]|uniref:Phosphate-binding protein n=1 Tax=Sporomusa sphaeroides DSM 2875 TaxID=1337886 RepID=A0ABP2C2U0_9FIRM|nr:MULTISPECIES: phosphate ABC transporter substrate-binding protein [Sporomusa]MCM0758768.1 phosphate ABC transporter substrate-binding protein [Sporomusa sphaeroides DSM 2875]OLS56830.1 phosphate-binding protein PstS 1 precursor [Sporomusa sphaeroides DSM 2875]CVK18777.1 Phosphate-binding protein PstS 1 precursor [Sporomusa sphaeroides DSM 2875]